MLMFSIPWFARITYAFVLFARALFRIASSYFGDAFETGFARIGFAVLFFAFAFQFVMMATVVTGEPFVFAAGGRRRQFVFGAGRGIFATFQTFVFVFEIIIIATAAGIFELNAIAATAVVRPFFVMVIAFAGFVFSANNRLTATFVIGKISAGHHIVQQKRNQGDR